jgi:hypothetical protein
MLRRTPLIILCLTLLLIPSLATAKKKKGAKDTVTGKFQPISEAEMAMKEISFAPGAPAVVLFEGEEIYFDKPATGAAVTRTTYQRRIKILDESGIEEYGDFVDTYDKDIEDLKVRARTVLPDGTEIDASENMHRDRGESGEQIVSIAFPKVQVGAIVEVAVQHNIQAIYEIRWVVQARIPVIENLFVYSPPSNLEIQQAVSLLTAEEAQPKVLKTPRGRSLVYHFRNIPPIPAEPNQPPLIELAKTLYIMPVAMRGPGYNLDFASDWPKWNKQEEKTWDDWFRTRQAECRELAKSVTEGVDGEINKAEAIRQAIKERMRHLYYSDEPVNRSPDEGLAIGTGSSADVAGVMVSMLRAADIEADLVAIRHRGDGLMPEGFPVPILFNDMLVRIKADGGTLFLSPVAEFPVWNLPAFAHGVVAMPIDGKTAAPTRLQDYIYSDNKVTREATIEIGDKDRLQISSVHTYRGVRAESWRRRLIHEQEDQRKELLRQDLRRWAPGASLESAEIENMEDVAQDLVIRCEFTVEGYLSRASKRLFVNPFIFGRITTDDWSSESRISLIDLGGPFESVDVIRVKLPEGVAEITTPNGADFNAGPAGFYQTSFSRKGETVVAKRHLRLKGYRFMPEQYVGVKAWFSDMAAQDDQPVVLRMQ